MRAITIACTLSLFGALLAPLGCGNNSEKKTTTPTGGGTKPPTTGWKAAVGDGGLILQRGEAK
jgi:hypothetical protein